MPLINAQAMREARAAPRSKLSSASNAHSPAAAIALPPRIDWRKTQSLFGGFAAADDSFAVTFRDVDPPVHGEFLNMTGIKHL